MQITSTISSIANVISRFSGKASVMFRNLNALPAVWQQHDCTGPNLFGRGEPAKQMLEHRLEPTVAGYSTSTGITSDLNFTQTFQMYFLPLRFTQPVRPFLFQRIS